MTILYKNKVVKGLTLTNGAYLMFYLGWRLTHTLNPHHIFFSLILFGAELLGGLNFFLFALMAFDLKKENPGSIIPDAKVDVFIPTYNEELEILEATIIGCINIRHSHNTYLLDDGRRPEVASLASRLGCHYLTREDNKHAKAGNINAALLQTDGEFIVVLDADMVPQPDFLEKTLGYFRDKKVAIVQLPQEFYNSNSIQHQLSGAWHEQALFFRVIQPGKNRINASFWCGSPSVVRRKALEDIGGVATETITEDFHTSIKLNSKGWKIKYHDEVLAFGIAPQSYHAFSVQRLRWAQGAMQIFRSKENPFLAPGLSLKQRLSHFSAILTYFDSYQKLFYLLTPIIILFTGILPISVNGWDFLIYWTPYIVLGTLTNIALGRGSFRYLDTEKYSLLKMFTFLRASLVLFWPRHLTFHVTPKKATESIALKDRRELVFHIFSIGITFLAILMGILNLVWESHFYNADTRNIFVAMFWSSYNLFLLGYTVIYVIRRLYYRQEYRFPTKVNVLIKTKDDTLVSAESSDISRHGLGVIIPDKYPFDNTLSLILQLPNGSVNVECQLVYSGVDTNGFRKLGLKFSEIPQEEQNKLIYFLFVQVPRVIFGNYKLGTPNPRSFNLELSKGFQV